MKIKVAEAKGRPLDWAVGMALDPGHTKTLWRLMKNGKWNPSTDWSQGGPLLDKHVTNVWLNNKLDSTEPDVWCGATYVKSLEGTTVFNMEGPTALIAVCRTYVASIFGSEVEIPQELL